MTGEPHPQPQLKQRDVRTREQALLVVDEIINDIASSKKIIRVKWGEIVAHSSAQTEREKVLDELEDLDEEKLCAIHGHPKNERTRRCNCSEKRWCPKCNIECGYDGSRWFCPACAWNNDDEPGEFRDGKWEKIK